MQPAPGFGIVLIFKQRVLSFVWWLHMKSWKWSSCTSQIHTSTMWPWASFPHVLFVLCGLSSQQISVTTFREMIKLLSQSVFWLSQRFFHQYSQGQRRGTPLQGSVWIVLNKCSVNIYEDIIMTVVVMKTSRHGWNILSIHFQRPLIGAVKFCSFKPCQHARLHYWRSRPCVNRVNVFTHLSL